MKKLVAALVVAAIVLVVIVTKQEQDTIIVYSSAEYFRNEAIQQMVNEKFPDWHVMIMYVPTAKAASKIQSEGDSTDADIVLGLETSYMERIKDNLADIKSLSRKDYLPEIVPDSDKYVIWERSGGCFAVNTEVLKKHNLPIPKTYDDLLDPQYKNLIAMPDPKSSGTGYNFYLNMVNDRGLDGALEYFDKLAVNIKQFTESGAGPVKLLLQGEIGIGLGMTFQVVNEINNGNPLQIVFPEEGSPYSLTGVGIVKGRENNPKVKAVADYLINEVIIYDKENFSPEQILKKQEIKIPNYPQNIQYADMTGADDLDLKDELLEKWKY